jgi:hypothetical protein
MLARQITTHPGQRCACAEQHGGSGQYVFLGPDGGHYRRSNYARRVFRPACDGRHEATPGRTARLVIADVTTWPGVPIAAWPPALPSTELLPTAVGPQIAFTPPTGRGVRAIQEDTPLACWLPIRIGLTPHGLRHSHKTWMAEDGIPEILAEQRLGHQVPGMRGLYAHASARMRDELKAALQTRWEDSLAARAALDPHSPVPLLDQFLAPMRGEICQLAQPKAPGLIGQPPLTLINREKTISQIPPRRSKGPTQTSRVRPIR